MFAHSASPGVAVPADGDYRLSGNWKIVSGIDIADWGVVLAMIAEGDTPRLTAAGRPDVRLFAVPAGQVKIQRTWNVSGMRGSTGASCPACPARKHGVMVGVAAAAIEDVVQLAV